MEMDKERQSAEQIQHKFHEHPLVFVGELSNQSRKAYCSGCEEVVSGPCFSCSECRYHLHRKCAEAPTEIKHPLHLRRHSIGLFLRKGPKKHMEGYACAFCKKKCNMFFYECHYCYFALDMTCALSSNNLAENFHEFQHDSHQHSLTCIENLKYELTRVYCSFCAQPLVGSVYICLECPFHLHKKCLDELPTKINHPSHRIHPLFLNNTTSLVCKFCQKKHDSGSLYHCSPCNFSIGIECLWPKPIIVEDKYHQHPFTPLLRQVSFICDACSVEGDYISYICSTCNIMVHKDCILLPRIVKVTRHDHALFHNYYLHKKEFEKKECQICFNEVKTEYGNYSCLKQGCNFVAHVKCAMEKEMYDVIDQANDEDEESSENSAMTSSITRVIESNEQGEATNIEHFSHGHYLILGNKIKEDDDDKCCDGCMLSISTPFYLCSQSQCEFLLHKACAELPRKRRLWFHLPLTTLNLLEFFTCDQCDHCCSGFAYQSDGEYNFCLRCARTPHTLSLASSQGHKHCVFFDFNFSGKYCNACGARCDDGAFKCKDCTLVLDFACITLPKTTRHKCDEHNLALAFHEENEDPKQHYCDVCEEKRDPNYWFYHCAICDNSTHPTCVLGQFPFLKMGVTWDYWNHPHTHPLILAKMIYEICSECGKPCQDEVALKCKDCTDNKYVIHFRCRGW